MKLQEIFDQLSTGEFCQISIGGAAAGVINTTNYANVLSHVNLGLTAIFKRFTLKEGRLVLQMQDGRTTYQINSAFAVNARRSRESVRYILDTADDPFSDDILKIERVMDDCGIDLPLNDASDTASVFTPSALTLRVPADLDSGTLTLVYRANHPKIVVGSDTFDPTRVEVQLPDSHMEPLLYYVASRVHNPIGMSNEFHAGNSYYAKYEAACQQLEGKGLQVDQGQTNTRLYRGGWV